MSEESKLTDKQQRFVEEYLVDLNATQAAIRAGYSKKTAQQMGSENLSKPVIQDGIATKLIELSERTEITVEKVIEQLIEDRTFARECVNPSAAVRATELMGKHLNMFVDRHEHSGPGGGPIPTDDLSKLTNEELEERLSILDKHIGDNTTEAN